MHLKVGWIYLRDPEKEVFHLATWYGIDNDAIPQFKSILQDTQCSCQETLIQDVTSQRAEIRQCKRLLLINGLNHINSHITIPLSARDQQLGVINLLCENEIVINPEDMDLLTSIGSQISEIVSNAWLHLKLVEKEASRQLLLKSLVEAQEEERRRLARELHDGAGQTLTSLLVRLKMIENKAILPQVKSDLQLMQSLVSDTIEQIRTLAHQLRPAALEEFGLPVALEALVEDMVNQENLQASCDCRVTRNEIPNEIEAVLYRIAQEGLTNVVRHSQASHLNLIVEKNGQDFLLTIEDDGIGFDPTALGTKSGKRHLGLISMKERAEMLGGGFDVYTAPSKGTLIRVSIPTGDI